MDNEFFNKALKIIGNNGMKRGELSVVAASGMGGARYGKSQLSAMLLKQAAENQEKMKVAFLGNPNEEIQEAAEKSLRGLEESKVLVICPTEAPRIYIDDSMTVEPSDLKKKKPIHHGPVIKRGKGKTKKW